MHRAAATRRRLRASRLRGPLASGRGRTRGRSRRGSSSCAAPPCRGRTPPLPTDGRRPSVTSSSSRSAAASPAERARRPRRRHRGGTTRCTRDSSRGATTARTTGCEERTTGQGPGRHGDSVGCPAAVARMSMRTHCGRLVACDSTRAGRLLPRPALPPALAPRPRRLAAGRGVAVPGLGRVLRAARRGAGLPCGRRPSRCPDARRHPRPGRPARPPADAPRRDDLGRPVAAAGARDGLRRRPAPPRRRPSASMPARPAPQDCSSPAGGPVAPRCCARCATQGVVELLGGPERTPAPAPAHARVRRARPRRRARRQRLAARRATPRHLGAGVRLAPRPWPQRFTDAGVGHFVVDEQTVRDSGGHPHAAWRVAGTDLRGGAPRPRGHQPHLVLAQRLPGLAGLPRLPRPRGVHRHPAVGDHRARGRRRAASAPTTRSRRRSPGRRTTSRTSWTPSATSCCHAHEVSGEPGLVVAAYDTELFGHWWHEGPAFLGKAIRALRRAGITVTTLEKALAARATSPATSTWRPARGARARTSRCGTARRVRQIAHENEWLQRRWLDLLARERAAGRLHTRRPDLDQLLQTLWHALSSDWAFLVTRGQSVDYARRRAELHRRDFHQLAQLSRTADATRRVDEARRLGLAGRRLPRPRRPAQRAPQPRLTSSPGSVRCAPHDPPGYAGHDRPRRVVAAGDGRGGDHALVADVGAPRDDDLGAEPDVVADPDRRLHDALVLDRHLERGRHVVEVADVDVVAEQAGLARSRCRSSS